MPQEKTPGPFYVGRNGGVWKHSIETKNPDGSSNHTLGFMICEEIPDYIEMGRFHGSEVLAEMLNRAVCLENFIDKLEASQKMLTEATDILKCVGREEMHNGSQS